MAIVVMFALLQYNPLIFFQQSFTILDWLTFHHYYDNSPTELITLFPSDFHKYAMGHMHTQT